MEEARRVKLGDKEWKKRSRERWKTDRNGKKKKGKVTKIVETVEIVKKR